MSFWNGFEKNANAFVQGIKRFHPTANTRMPQRMAPNHAMAAKPKTVQAPAFKEKHAAALKSLLGRSAKAKGLTAGSAKIKGQKPAGAAMARGTGSGVSGMGI